MGDMLIEQLVQIGLSEKEAAVYFAALENGAATIIQLSQTTGIKRSTVYTIIDRLVNQGLIHTEIAGVKKYYVAAHPEKIQELLKHKQQTLVNVMPELTAMYLQLKGSDSFIKQFEGLPGIRKVYRQLLSELKSGDDYLVISDTEKWQKMDEKFFKQFIRRRAKLDLNIRVILQASKKAAEHINNQEGYNLQVKTMPKSTILTSTIVIVPHKIIITQVISPYMSIVIENKSIVQTQKAIFEILWGVLHPS